jgi:diguanylate cyclase (GGDEF)-like protein
MRYKHNVVDLDYNGFTFYGAVLRTDDYSPDLRGLMQFKHMSTQAFLRRFIHRYGEINTVLVFTALLIALVVAIIVTLQWIQHGTVDTAGLSGPILLTALVGGVVLYHFIALVSQLDRSEGKLRALSMMDDLTDVFNRRYIIEQVEKELAKTARYGTIFSVLAVDIDNFRKINEKHGHLAGDAVLQAMANTCMNNLRAMDIFARFSGEQFMFMIPEADKTDVATFAEKIRQALENTPVVYDREEIRFTVSIGVKICDARAGSLESVLNAADDAVAEAKKRGRNCIVIYEDGVPIAKTR